VTGVSFGQPWRWLRWGLLAVPLIAVLILWLVTIPPLMPSYAKVRRGWQPSESWLHDRNGLLLDSIRVDFHKRRLGWLELKGIAPAVPRLLIANEDRRFRSHDGIDWLATASAIKARWTGENSRGASTITMQLAGFLDPSLALPGQRNWIDKLRQMRAARAIEAGWNKDQILEAYLNLAGFRGEAQGIGAAALGLFGKSPDALGEADSTLVALLPSPEAGPEALARRACRIAPRLLCPDLRVAALAMTNSARRIELDPGLAPHLAAKLLTRPGSRLRTTLDRQVQAVAIQALRQQLRSLGPGRARDGAVIVADNQTGDILAWVGGVGGQSTAAAVDGADAPRQAGSTLKPFLYALAMEKGALTPASIIDDSPVQLDTASGLYIPQNYDREFKGPVSVRTALASSLNVPAVRALILTGTDALRDRLWDSGYQGIVEDGDYYGFSLALGSAEVTLREQAAAYRGLARGGAYAPLRLVASDPVVRPRQVTSPQSAWLVADMLADPVARATTFGMDSLLKLPFWAAVKTGTSKAMRDNWCVGFSDRFTVAVWIGNLEGDSMRAVSGTSGAAPVWRSIMLALHQGRPGLAPARPEGIEQRPVHFAANLEAPRREYFLHGTAQSEFAMAPASAQRPRITNPISGSIYALDPDIPVQRQRLGVSVSGSVAGHRLILDRRDLGAADARPQLALAPGVHRLLLVDSGGKPVDRVQFTMR
jgi:penicillin-binding protein 1C